MTRPLLLPPRRLLVLQRILPLTLQEARGEVAPAPSQRGSGFWKRPPGGEAAQALAQGRGARPVVTIATRSLRLPEGLARIGCDSGQVGMQPTDAGCATMTFA